MSPKHHKSGSYKRLEPTRTDNPTVLIVCEGETERVYFEQIRVKCKLASVKVDNKKHITDALGVVKRAVDLLKKEKVSESSKYDKVWCVFDVEIPTDANLQRALADAHAHEIEVALTNPCFEYWFILHFEKMSRLFNSADEVKKVLESHIPNYKESDEKNFDRVYPETERACNHAEQVIRNMVGGTTVSNCNSSTEVHRLVKYLQSLAPNYSR